MGAKVRSMEPNMHESAHDTQEGEVVIQWSDLARAARVAPGSRVDLESDYDPGRHDRRLTKDSGAQALAQAVRELEQLQDRFYAQADTALLTSGECSTPTASRCWIQVYRSSMVPATKPIVGERLGSAIARALGTDRLTVRIDLDTTWFDWHGTQRITLRRTECRVRRGVFGCSPALARPARRRVREWERR